MPEQHERIWLQQGTGDDATWCQDQINDDDVEYVRADLVAARDAALEAAREALAIIKRQPRNEARIFPYHSKTIGTYFAQAVKIAEVPDLRFHDLRHEATSRLFERGYSIIEVQQFTLHESWDTLRRYTHLRPEDVREL